MINCEKEKLFKEISEPMCRESLFEALDIKKASLPIIHIYANINNKKTTLEISIY